MKSRKTAGIRLMPADDGSAVCKRMSRNELVEQGQELDTGGDGMATWIQDQVSKFHWWMLC